MSAPTPPSGAGHPRPPKPAWRRVADFGERAVGGRIEPLVQRSDFAIALSIAKKVDMRLRGMLTAQTSRALHKLNIPTRTDIRRVHEHLDAVDAHVSEVVREHSSRQDLNAAAGERGDGRADPSDPAETYPESPPDA